MEVWSSIIVKTSSIPQATAFADAFPDVFHWDLKNTGDLLPQLEAFRKNAGHLQLDDISFDTADTFEREFRQVFLKTALSAPDMPFSACVISSGDLESIHRFAYADGYIHRRYLFSDSRPLQDECPECGTEYPDTIFLETWLNSGSKERCSNCGSPPFQSGTYRLTEEDICIREFLS